VFIHPFTFPFHRLGSIWKYFLHTCTNRFEIYTPGIRLSHLLRVSRFESLSDPSTRLDGLTWSLCRDDLSPRSGQKIQSVVKVYAFHNSAPHGTNPFSRTVHRVHHSRARVIGTRKMKARSIILSLASYLPFCTFRSTFFFGVHYCGPRGRLPT
jgi:hypothetical protein